MSQRLEHTYQDTAYGITERDRLILDQLPQVHYIAAHIQERLPQSVVFEDLVNAGVIGLIEAIGSYDPGRGAQFKTFAKFRIRGAIIDSLRELDWAPRLLRQKSREIDEATSKLEARLGRQPSEQEIADELKMDLKDFYKLLREVDGLFLVSQQEIAAYDHSDTHDPVENARSSAQDSFDILLKLETDEHLAEALAKLDKYSRRVLSLYYRDELTMKQIAQALEISETRVSQIHSAALLKLRTSLHGKLAHTRKVTVSLPFMRKMNGTAA